LEGGEVFSEDTNPSAYWYFYDSLIFCGISFEQGSYGDKYIARQGEQRSEGLGIGGTKDAAGRSGLPPSG